MAITAMNMKRKYEEMCNEAPLYYCQREGKHKRKKPEREYIGMTIDKLFPELKGITHSHPDFNGVTGAIKRSIIDFNDGKFDSKKLTVNSKYRLPGIASCKR